MTLVLESRDVAQFGERSSSDEFTDLSPILRVGGNLLGESQIPDHALAPDAPPGTTSRPSNQPSAPMGAPIQGDLEFVVRSRGRMAGLVLENGIRVAAGEGRVKTSWVAARGLMEVTIRTSRQGGPISFNVRTNDLEGTDAEAAWEVLHFLAMCDRRSEFSLGVPGGSRPWNRFPDVDALIDPETERLALQLRQLSRYAGRAIPMPGEFSAELRSQLQIASTLLAGGIVHGSWLDAEVTIDRDTASQFGPGDDFMVELHRPYEVHIPGELPISVDRWARLRHARVIQRTEAGDGVRVLLKPGSTDLVEYQRRSWPEVHDLPKSSIPSVEVGTWLATYDNQVLASAHDLETLAKTVERVGIQPDAVIRSGNSDLPGMP